MCLECEGWCVVNTYNVTKPKGSETKMKLHFPVLKIKQFKIDIDIRIEIKEISQKIFLYFQ